MIKEEQINFNKFFKNIQPCYSLVKDEEEFNYIKNYFAKSFDDLASKTQIKHGKSTSCVSQSIFSGYLNMPLVISDRIFEAFKVEGDDREILSKASFVGGMCNLFLGSLNKLESLTFKILDIGSKGEILIEDVQLMLTYLNFTCDNIVHNIEEIVKNFFDSKSSLKYDEYLEKIENKNSNVFILILMFVYSKQPFTEEVINFYLENSKISQTKNNKVLKEKSKDYIMAPSKEILFYQKYFTRHFHNPTRKSSTKDILNFHEQNVNKILLKTKVSSNTAPIELIINEDESLEISFQDTDAFVSSLSLNTSKGKFSCSGETHFETQVFELTNNKKGKALLRGKIVLVDNNLFSLSYVTSKNDYLLKKVHPLSGCYFTICDEIRIHNISFFPFAILSQYGNSLANVTNVFLCMSKLSLMECISNLQFNMKIRDIHDNYMILNQLGSGFFGTVNLGENKLTGKKVAIKMINKNNLSYEQFGMVKYEVDIMNFIRNSPHPNVVTPLEIFEDKLFIYYVLEYMPGGTLRSYMKTHKRLKEDDVKKVVTKMTSALSFLDKMGIIHRDIKAENILLGDNDLNTVKLSDFGLSTIKFHNQKANETCGTLIYSAPELLLRFNYDNKVDIWSLGVLTYYLLAGHFPFEGNHTNKKEIIFKICKNGINFPFILGHACKLFIEKCLTKNPAERFDISTALTSQFIHA